MRQVLIAVLVAMLGTAALANDYKPVQDRNTFLSLVDGRELQLGVPRVALRVLPDGTITGRALGWDITGKWRWESGFFCREMDWSGYPIPQNCQLVEQRGSELRFTSNKGAGQSAAFRLR